MSNVRSIACREEKEEEMEYLEEKGGETNDGDARGGGMEEEASKEVDGSMGRSMT